MEGSDFSEVVPQWTCNHFSVHSATGDIPWLLRKLAASITELGAIDVLDVVVSQDDSTQGVTGTVYFSFREPDKQPQH